MNEDEIIAKLEWVSDGVRDELAGLFAQLAANNKEAARLYQEIVKVLDVGRNEKSQKTN